MLSLRNVSKHYEGVYAVDDCSFNVREGLITALIGPNGSGKTTIFNLISGIDVPDTGSIRLKGKELGRMSVHEVSNLGISRMFQRTRLFENFSVMENLLLALDNDDQIFWKNIVGLNRDTRAKVAAARAMLRRLNLLKLQHAPVRSLSYGQKRLVDLARTLLNPHELLLLDEPVAGVHPSMRREIAAVLRAQKKTGKTILLIEHDMVFTTGIADHIVVMDAGEVIAEGPPEKVVRNSKVLEAYLGD